MPSDDTLKVCSKCHEARLRNEFHRSLRNKDGLRCECKQCRNPKPVTTPFERFWSRVDKNGPVPVRFPELGPCWIWTAGKGKAGYGTIYWKGKLRYAHRISYELAYGGFPEGKPFACHRCDTPSCVNPVHLFPGDDYDNAIDREIKNRGKQPHGEKNKRHKLTDQKILEIRRKWTTGTVTQRSLGKEFGVDPTTIGHIVRREWWKHVL